MAGHGGTGVPGVVSLVVLVRIRRTMGDPVESRDVTAQRRGRRSRAASHRPIADRLPRVFWLFAAAAAATSGGLVTFAVIAYHLAQGPVVTVAAVPLIYAAAMGAAALAAVGSGWLFDRTGGRVLFGPATYRAAVPALAFAGSPPIVVTGVLLWGVAGGVSDSTY